MDGKTALLDSSVARLLDLASQIQNNQVVALDIRPAKNDLQDEEPAAPAPIVDLVAPQPVNDGHVPADIVGECEVANPSIADPQLDPVEDRPADLQRQSGPSLDDYTRLELLHSELGELAGRRLGRRKRQRQDEARQEEREVLARLGYDSYLEFMVMSSRGRHQPS
jgi:hypothetical protein